MPAFTLVDLPYDRAALEPHMSAETLDYHHGKHHQTYVDKVNAAIEEGGLEPETLVALVQKAKRDGEQTLFDNAAQIWNHNFFWRCLAPEPSKPSSALQRRIDEAFGSTDAMMEKLKKEAADHFGSGWGWLVLKGDKLAVTSLHDADAPIVHDGITPLLTLDVWEHAYYIDHRNERPKYLEALTDNLIDWAFVEENLDGKGAERADQECERETA